MGIWTEKYDISSLNNLRTISCLFWVWVRLFYYLRLAILHSFPTHFVKVINTDHHKAEKYFWKYQAVQNFPLTSSRKTLYEQQEGRTKPWELRGGCAPLLHTRTSPFPQDLTTTMCLAACKKSSSNCSLSLTWFSYLVSFDLTLLSSDKHISSDILRHTWRFKSFIYTKYKWKHTSFLQLILNFLSFCICLWIIYELLLKRRSS